MECDETMESKKPMIMKVVIVALGVVLLFFANRLVQAQIDFNEPILIEFDGDYEAVLACLNEKEWDSVVEEWTVADLTALLSCVDGMWQIGDGESGVVDDSDSDDWDWDSDDWGEEWGVTCVGNSSFDVIPTDFRTIYDRCSNTYLSLGDPKEAFDAVLGYYHEFDEGELEIRDEHTTIWYLRSGISVSFVDGLAVEINMGGATGEREDIVFSQMGFNMTNEEINENFVQVYDSHGLDTHLRYYDEDGNIVSREEAVYFAAVTAWTDPTVGIVSLTISSVVELMPNERCRGWVGCDPYDEEWIEFMLTGRERQWDDWD